MKWIKRILLALGILIVLGLALPFLIPLNGFVPRVEKLLAEAIHEPVAIRSMRLVLLPQPGIEVKGISIGKLKEAQAENIRLAVDLFSLFKTVKVVSSITVDSAIFSQDALTNMPDWFKSDGSPKKLLVKRVLLHNTNLNLKAVPLTALDADIDLGEEGNFKQARIEYSDRSASLLVTPQENDYALNFEAHKWKPPAGPALQFDTLHIQALVDGKQLSMQKINAALYAGNLQGSAQLGWHNGWKLRGHLRSKGMEIRQLASMLSPETSVSGKLDSDSNFEMHAKNAGLLFDAPMVESDFRVKDGVLHNFDLVGAMKSLSKEGTRGGQTRFDEFSGHLRITGKTYRLQQLKIGSGILAAEGNLDILPNKNLNGHMQVEMKGTATLVSMPLQISGNIKDPLLRPTTGAMTGAVAGTAVLGPLGTSLGAKAGDFVEKIFK